MFPETFLKPDPSLDGEQLFDEVEENGKRFVTLVDQPFDMPPVSTTSAKEAFEQVLNNVGATLPKRDAVDLRIIEQVKQRTGRMINSPSEVGGWPELESGDAPADSDEDGMPDEWESKHGFNPVGSFRRARRCRPGRIHEYRRVSEQHGPPEINSRPIVAPVEPGGYRQSIMRTIVFLITAGVWSTTVSAQPAPPSV
ncbi:MAG: hypothetical protein KatS3mg104_0601 [Phycisphaerae bacterium]|nr:MAG: hypothetical protein KatS3mg104_0601 [Phycisphaerae bacterium]